MSISFTRRLTVSASTKRNPAPSGGKVATPVVNLASLNVAPLDPVSSEMMARYGTGAPEVLLQTFCPAVDVKVGDRLVVGSKEYPIRAVSDWDGMGSINAFKVLVLEAVKS